MAACFVTTKDNPWDYWTQFDEWFAFDTEKGYNTCAYLGRIAKTSTQMSEADYEHALNEAVDEILRINVTGNYVRTEPKNEKELYKTVKERN